jgi:hypothetical protein
MLQKFEEAIGASLGIMYDAIKKKEKKQHGLLTSDFLRKEINLASVTNINFDLKNKTMK